MPRAVRGAPRAHGALLVVTLERGAQDFLGPAPTFPREAQDGRAVHEAVGLIDVSTLGKLDLKGRDAGAFLDWLHPNRFSDLKPGRTRYRVMCDDAGIILVDGVVARISDDHYLVTTATGSIDAIENELFKRQFSPNEVAAIFVEALQGEGGYIVPPPNFLPDLRALCDKHGIILVCDEIQSGCGRTGKWFAFEHFGIEPDLILMAKGLASGMPLGAVIAKSDIMNWPPGAQGSTFGGNPVCCAAALATIELVESSYMANAEHLGKRLLSSLAEIADQRPRAFGVSRIEPHRLVKLGY